MPAADVRVGPTPRGVELKRRRFGFLRGSVGRLVGVSPYMTIRLDGLAAEAWLLLDGERSVAQIRDQLVREHPREDDVGPRLGRLLGELASRGFITF